MSVRRRSYCRIGLAAVTVFVLSAVALGAPSASAGRPGPSVPKLDWQPCGDEFPGFDCATATVPMDYRQPHKASTSIALARVPAADQANRIGTVFVNPGGPGGSGVEPGPRWFRRFSREQPRTAASTSSASTHAASGRPTRCIASRAKTALNEYFARSAGLPVPARPVPPLLRGVQRSSATVASTAAIRSPAHMSTADVARDLDLLRRAVGDAKLTYLGFSYGSYLGNTYANMFPQERAGAGDRRRARPAPVVERLADRLRPGRDRRQEFDEFLRLCDEAGPDCAFAAPEGSRARWEALAEALEASRSISATGSSTPTTS